MYEYRAEQGPLKVTLELGCDAHEPLLTTLSAFFYYHKDKALLDTPVKVFQDGRQVLEEQVEEERQKIIHFFQERGIIK